MVSLTKTMSKIRSASYIALILSGMLALWNSCADSITGEKNTNLPPDSFIFVQTVGNDTLNPQRSVQRIFWDGRDPDGFIKGYLYTWKDNPGDADWIYTTEQNQLFALEITGVDTQYTFMVKAIDNLDLEDPTPARQLFPIINSQPEIDWSVNSRIPDTTFTVASFSWQAADPDGDLTIVSF